jgi:DNA-binding MarR family transcriptional regulator
MKFKDADISAFCGGLWALRNWLASHPELSGFNPRHDVLVALGKSPGLQLGYSELEAELGRSSRTIHYLVAALTREGFCEVRTHGPDRRFRAIALTGKGCDLLAEEIGQYMTHLVPQLRDFGASES